MRSPRLLNVKSVLLRWSGCRARPIRSMVRIRFCFTTVSCEEGGGAPEGIQHM